MERVAVLGAGLTGCGVALELARRGIDVTLVDQDDLPVNRASLRNEGKIHLGLIYAKDTSLITARRQLDGALQFRAILARWLGAAVDRLAVSTPFVYLVAADSIATPADLEAHYAAVEALYRERITNDGRLDYLGRRPAQLFRRGNLRELSEVFNVQQIQAAFHTAELAIHTDELAALLRAAVAECPRIRFLPRHRVEAVERQNGALRILGRRSDHDWQMRAEQVVNALWEDRRRIDASLGVPPEPGWVHRLKFRIIVRLPERLRGLPSATMVLGRYGDVAIRPDGSAYVSWYPLGLRGWTHALAPPAAWDAPCRGEVSTEEARTLAAQTLAVIGLWYPGIDESTPLHIDAGVIVAYGNTDVDDTGSGLHHRSHIGVVSVDGYHSVEPGKLTTAPRTAMVAAARVVGEDTGS